MKSAPPPAFTPTLTAEKIARQILERSRRIRTLSTMASVRIYSEKESRRFKEVILFGEKGEMRLESLNPFGQTAFLVVTRGEELLLFNHSANRFFHGRSDTPFLRQIMGLNLELKELKEIIFQNFVENHPPPGFTPFQITSAKEGILLTVLFSSGQKKREILLNGNNKPAKVTHFHKGGGVRYEVHYKKYETLDKYPFPRRIEVIFPQRKITLILKLYETELNASLADSLFTVTVPSNAIPYGSLHDIH